MTELADRRSDWTGEDLDRLRAFDAEGLSVEALAERLGRTLADVRERLTLIHSSSNLPNYGPDEEGDVPVPCRPRTEESAAWVHVDHEREDKPEIQARFREPFPQ